MQIFFSDLFFVRAFLNSGRKARFVNITSWFAIIGIMLGVGTLIVVMSVMNGFRHDLLEKILGINAHIQITRNDGQLINPDKIKFSQESVISLAPVQEGHSMISTPRQAGGALVRGISGAENLQRKLLKEAIIDGISWQEFDESDGIIIGRRMALDYGLKLGDNLTLTSPVAARTAFGSVPRAKSYQIVGLFEIGMYDYDKNVIFMNLDEAKKFFAITDSGFSRYEIILQDPNEAWQVGKKLSQELGEEFRISNWQNSNSSLVAALIVERNVMFLILTMIILVAAFNIITGQIMLVRDKQYAIAILRASGASKAKILRIFLYSGCFLGIGGTLLGLIFGILFAENIENIRQFVQFFIGSDLFSAEIYYLTRLPARIEYFSVLAVAFMAIFITILAALIPALQAANTDPIKALRHE